MTHPRIGMSNMTHPKTWDVKDDTFKDFKLNIETCRLKKYMLTDITYDVINAEQLADIFVTSYMTLQRPYGQK